MSFLTEVLSLFSTLEYTQFLIYLVGIPIAVIIVVSLLLMKYWENKPPFTETILFKIVYVLVLYSIAVIITSLIFSLV
jgi:hypothetical protein